MSKKGKHIKDKAKQKKKIKQKQKNKNEFEENDLSVEVSDRITDLFMEKEDRKEKKEKKKSKKNKNNNKNKKNSKEKAKNEEKFEENTVLVDAIISENENEKKKSKNKKSKNIKKNRSNTKKQEEISNKKNDYYSKKREKNTKTNYKKQNKNVKKNVKARIIKKVLKMIILALICGIAFIYMSTSPMFNITEIEIIGNNKIDKKNYLNLSKLQINTNIFDFKKNEIISNLRTNAYVENVTIKRKIPNKVEISIEERSIKYILEGIKNEYIYIDKNGYVLEKNKNKTDNTQLIGASTELKDIVVGEKLNEDDINKIKETIQIENSMLNNELVIKCDKIDISSRYDYILIFEEQAKEVHLGDINDLNTKILFMKYILKEQENIPGKIFLNQSKMYFSPN